MLGAVRGDNPDGGFPWDDTRRYVEAAKLSDADRAKIFELQRPPRLPAPGRQAQGPGPVALRNQPSSRTRACLTRRLTASHACIVIARRIRAGHRDRLVAFRRSRTVPRPRSSGHFSRARRHRGRSSNCRSVLRERLEAHGRPALVDAVRVARGSAAPTRRPAASSGCRTPGAAPRRAAPGRSGRRGRAASPRPPRPRRSSRPRHCRWNAGSASACWASSQAACAPSVPTSDAPGQPRSAITPLSQGRFSASTSPHRVPSHSRGLPRGLVFLHPAQQFGPQFLIHDPPAPLPVSLMTQPPADNGREVQFRVVDRPRRSSFTSAR